MNNLFKGNDQKDNNLNLYEIDVDGEIHIFTFSPVEIIPETDQRELNNYDGNYLSKINLKLKVIDMIGLTGLIEGFDIYVDENILSLNRGAISSVARVPYEFRTTETVPIFSSIFSINNVKDQEELKNRIRLFQYFIESILIKSENQEFFFVIGGIIFSLKKNKFNVYEYSFTKI